MPLIVFSGKELHASCLYFRISLANGTPGRPQRRPSNISKRDRELEKLLRNAVRVRNAQIRAARTKTDATRGTARRSS